METMKPVVEEGHIYYWQGNPDEDDDFVSEVLEVRAATLRFVSFIFCDIRKYPKSMAKLLDLSDLQCLELAFTEGVTVDLIDRLVCLASLKCLSVVGCSSEVIEKAKICFDQRCAYLTPPELVGTNPVVRQIHQQYMQYCDECSSRLGYFEEEASIRRHLAKRNAGKPIEDINE